MRKLSLLKSFFLLCAFIVGSLNVLADTETVTPGDNVFTGATNFSYVAEKLPSGSTAPSFSSTNQYVRLYVNNTLTITPLNEETITGISISAKWNQGGSSGNKAYPTGIAVNTGELNYEAPGTGDKTITWSGSTTNAIVFTIEGDKGNLQVSSITVTYTSGSTPISKWSVTYDANGATSGSVPTDATEYNAENNTVTVLGNTGNLAKEHYTFTGWNTKADGTGTGYVANNEFTISSNTTLYAQWAINTHNVTLPEADTYGTYTMSATNPVAYGTEVTLTYTPASGYENYAATWNVNGEVIAKNEFTMPDEAVTVTVSVEKKTTSEMTIDFEKDANTYTDWTFTNIVSNYKNSGVDTHGGSKYGSTDGKASGSIQTKEKVDPVSLTCYVSKQSTNTSSSTWYVKVSSDGSTWTEVKSTSATDMGKGEWKVFTADFKNYSDVYVSVEYSGSTAVRLIDDLTLTVNSSSQSSQPSFTASDVNIAYDATEGNVTFTLNNGVESGIVTAATEADWLTLGTVGETNVPFTTTANESASERTTTVTLKYTYNNNETVTKDVTVTQAGNPNVIPTIAEVRTQATGSSVKTKGIVTSCSGTTAYIQDASAAICVYGTALTVGDEVSVSGTLSNYNGLLEITSPTAEVLSQNNVVTPEEMTIAEVKASEKQGWLVKIVEATVTDIDGSNTTIAQGANTIVVRGISSDVVYAVNDVLTLTGNIGCYNNTAQIANPTNVQVKSVPTITVDPASINAPASGADGTITVTYNNITDVVAEIVFCDAEGAVATYDWIMTELNSENNVEYVIGANTTTETRKAYLKVYALDDNGEDVYSPLITITQAAPAVTNTYTLATSITSGKRYVIASGTEDDVTVMAGQNANNRGSINATVSSNSLSIDSNAGATEFVIFGPDASGSYSIWDATDETKGYLYAASSSSNYLRSQTINDMNGKWSIEIDEDGEATIVAQGDKTNKYLRVNGSLFSCYGENSTIQALPYLYAKDDNEEVPSTVNLTLNDYGYATYASTKVLDFLDNEDANYSAWQVSSIIGTEITYSQLKETVKPGTGILLKGKGGKTITLNALPGSGKDLSSSNKLVGITEATDVAEGEYYGLYNDNFLKVGAGTVPANKALLPATAVPSSARQLTFVFEDGETTTIADIRKNAVGGDFFDLQGRKIANPTKGLYIVNGKKVVVK